MNTACLIFLCVAPLLAADPFPELPDGPMEKIYAWRILDKQWQIIEPILFTEDGKAHIGRKVHFDSKPVTLGKPLVVRTVGGTTAIVSNIPKGDMDLIREFRRPPKSITIDGVLTAIDPSTHTIKIKAYGVSPGN